MAQCLPFADVIRSAKEGSREEIIDRTVIGLIAVCCRLFERAEHSKHKHK